MIEQTKGLTLSVNAVQLKKIKRPIPSHYCTNSERVKGIFLAASKIKFI